MRENRFAPGERRFLLAAAAAAVVCVALAFGGTVPLSRAQSAPASVQEPLREVFRVDLNTAGAEELATLPGVGEQKAEAIVEYRRAHGAFSSVEAVANVPGITPEMTEKWRSIAYVS